MIGFDIGGTKCAVTVGKMLPDGGLHIINKKSVPTEKNITPYELIDKLCNLAMEMTNDYDIVGISCGGPLDSKRGIILSPPNLTGWDEIHITEYIENKLSCKAFLQNDANACAVAEWLYGAGKGYNNMIFLTFGTGLGAGLILDGRLYTGANDNAGEVGHIRLNDFGPVGYGKMGSFEGFCSGGGIGRLAGTMALEQLQQGTGVSYCKDISLVDSITAKDVAIAANAGNADAIKVFEECGKKLGAGLSILIDILNPEVIVIGSVYMRCENLISPSMTEVMKKEALAPALKVCRVVPAALGESIGDYAALSVAAMNMK